MIGNRFNKDLDRYLDRRSSSPGGRRDDKVFDLKILFRSKPKEEKVPDLAPRKVHVLYKKPNMIQRLMERKQEDPFKNAENIENFDVKTGMRTDIKETNREIKELRREEEILENKRESLIKRWMRGLRHEEEQIAEIVPQEPTLDQETIDTLKLMGKWLTKLDTDAKRSFRDSGDYAKYKAFIDKYGLSKKKQ